MGYGLRSSRAALEHAEEVHRDEIRQRLKKRRHNASTPFFSSLPLDIRTRIYRYILCGLPSPTHAQFSARPFTYQTYAHESLKRDGPSLKTVKYDREFEIHRNMLSGSAPWQTTYQTQNTALLLTCKSVFEEARQIALGSVTVTLTGVIKQDDLDACLSSRIRSTDCATLKTVRNLRVVIYTEVFYDKHLWAALGECFPALDSVIIDLSTDLFYHSKVYRDIWYALQFVPAEKVIISGFLAEKMSEKFMKAHGEFVERGVQKMQMVLLGLRGFESPLPSLEDVKHSSHALSIGGCTSRPTTTVHECEGQVLEQVEQVGGGIRFIDYSDEDFFDDENDEDDLEDESEGIEIKDESDE